MGALDRYVRHPSAGAARDLVATDQPFGAGRHQVLLAGNARWCETINFRRNLCSHPGVREIWCASLHGAAWTNVPVPGDLGWDTAPVDGGCALSLGTHYIYHCPGSNVLPVLKCRARWWIEDGTLTLGACLAVMPGASPPARTMHSVGSTTSSTTAVDLALTLPLTEADVQPATLAPGNAPAEAVSLLRTTVYLGAYNSLGVKTVGRKGYLVGVTLWMEPPT